MLIFSCKNSKITGECWIPPKKETPHPRTKEKHQREGRSSEITFRIKPHTCQRCLRGPHKTLGSPGMPESEPDLPLSLSVSSGGMDQQGPTAGAGALDSADLGIA